MRPFLITITALALFLGGIALLLFSGGFWGYLLGIPAVQIGIIFIIFTFEKLSREASDDDIERQKEELKQNFRKAAKSSHT